MARPLRQFRSDEAGFASGLSLFSLLICLMMAGLAIDVANGWRHRALLDGAAAAAAHAGARVLAAGGSAEQAIAAAEDIARRNLPPERYGPIIADAMHDIVPVHYEAALNRVTAPGEINALQVRLHRSSVTENAVPTYVLRLVGIGQWDIQGAALAAVVPSRRCDPATGLFAGGEVVIGGSSEVGPGVCLHGQLGVRLLADTRFAAGARLSTPDLADCGPSCVDVLHPGVEAAKVEANMPVGPAWKEAVKLAAALRGSNAPGTIKQAFFATRPLARDLSALDELGIETRGLQAGSIVKLSADAFMRARELPGGLVYDISCAGTGTDSLAFGLPGPEALRDSALLTDCGLSFGADARLQGGVVVSTSRLETTVEAGALLGDPGSACNPAMASVVVAAGALRLSMRANPSNAAFVIGGDAVFEGKSRDTAVVHDGLSVHAAGTIRSAGPRVFRACPGASGALLPRLQLIVEASPIAG